MSNRSSSTAWLLSAAFPITVYIITSMMDPLGTPGITTASTNTPDEIDPSRAPHRQPHPEAQKTLDAILAYDASDPAPNPFRYRPSEIYDASQNVTQPRHPQQDRHDFVVTSILGGSNPIALINSKAYRTGDTLLADWTVTAIEPDLRTVLLTHTDGRTQTISLHTPTQKNR
jgi:hypothetical protein